MVQSFVLAATAIGLAMPVGTLRAQQRFEYAPTNTAQGPYAALNPMLGTPSMITSLPPAPPASSQTYAQAIAPQPMPPQPHANHPVVNAFPQATVTPQTDVPYGTSISQGVTQVAATFAQPSPPPETSFPQEPPIAERVVYQPVPTLGVNVFVPNLPKAWSLNAGVLFLRPSADNFGWGVLTTEKNYAGVFPIGQPYWNILQFSPGYSPGFQVGGSYTFANSGRDFQLDWQHMSMGTRDSAGVITPDGQWISPFSQTGPPTADNYAELYTATGVGKLQSAEAALNVSYDNVNADFGQYVNVGSSLRLRFLGGLQYAALQEQIISRFYGPSPLVIQLNQQSSFSGIGPRLGVDSSYQLRRGFRLTGQAANALLIGQTTPSQYVLTAISDGNSGIGVNQEYVASPPFVHTVYTANAKLGIGYSRNLQNGITLFCDGGYMAALFINPFSGYETNENIIALQLGSLSSGSIRHVLSNFAVDGMYFNAGLRW